MHFPATFLVATGSAGIAATSSSVVISLFVKNRPCAALGGAAFCCCPFGRRGQPEGYGGQRESGWMLEGVFLPMPRTASDRR